jgi:signal transduction histidine kinase
MIPVKTRGDAQSPRNAASLALTGGRSPLAQLLHALNQPLTGLQCSMEVALAGARTPEQYVRGLREGLELTERMRALVEAIREVVDGEEEKGEDSVTAELNTVLREVADDLGPVAEAKRVCIRLDCAAGPALLVRTARQRLAAMVFRLLDSALSLAARGSALRIETGGGVPAGGWMRIGWHAGGPRIESSRAELGLLVAQAGWERAGAEWNRERRENLETVRVGLPSISAAAGIPSLEPSSCNPSSSNPSSSNPSSSNPGASK